MGPKRRRGSARGSKSSANVSNTSDGVTTETQDPAMGQSSSTSSTASSYVANRSDIDVILGGAKQMPTRLRRKKQTGKNDDENSSQNTGNHFTKLILSIRDLSPQCFLNWMLVRY